MTPRESLRPCATPDYALDRRGRQIWTVREDDDRTGDVVGKGFKPQRTHPARGSTRCTARDGREPL